MRLSLDGGIVTMTGAAVVGGAVVGGAVVGVAVVGVAVVGVAVVGVAVVGGAVVGGAVVVVGLAVVVVGLAVVVGASVVVGLAVVVGASVVVGLAVVVGASVVVGLAVVGAVVAAVELGAATGAFVVTGNAVGTEGAEVGAEPVSFVVGVGAAVEVGVLGGFVVSTMTTLGWSALGTIVDGAAVVVDVVDASGADGNGGVKTSGLGGRSASVVGVEVGVVVGAWVVDVPAVVSVGSAVNANAFGADCSPLRTKQIVFSGFRFEPVDTVRI